MSRSTTVASGKAVSSRPSPAHAIGPSPSYGVRNSRRRAPASLKTVTDGGDQTNISLPFGLQAKFSHLHEVVFFGFKVSGSSAERLCPRTTAITVSSVGHPTFTGAA